MRLSHILIPVLSATLVSTVAAAADRLYQWIDPHTGTTQLSGRPPAWYRADAAGPRVFAFERGRLVDDSAVRLSERARRWVRAEALGTDPAALAAGVPESEAAGESEPPAKPSADTASNAPSAPPGAETPAGADSEAQAVTHLKDIIAAWDLLQTEEAKRVLARDAEQTTAPELP